MIQSAIHATAMTLGVTLYLVGYLLAVPGNLLKQAGERLCDFDSDR